jgi:hypothetical protein
MSCKATLLGSLISREKTSEEKIKKLEKKIKKVVQSQTPGEDFQRKKSDQDGFSDIAVDAV